MLKFMKPPDNVMTPLYNGQIIGGTSTIPPGKRFTTSYPLPTAQQPPPIFVDTSIPKVSVPVFNVTNTPPPPGAKKHKRLKPQIDVSSSSPLQVNSSLLAASPQHQMGSGNTGGNLLNNIVVNNSPINRNNMPSYITVSIPNGITQTSNKPITISLPQTQELPPNSIVLPTSHDKLHPVAPNKSPAATPTPLTIDFNNTNQTNYPKGKYFIVPNSIRGE